MKNILIIILGFATYILLHFSLIGYDNTKSHPTLNKVFLETMQKIFENKNPEELGFQLKLGDILNKLPGPAITNPGYFESTTGESEQSMTPEEWISHGGYSADEPEVPAAVRHFYDPVGLKDGKKYLTNRGTYWEGFYSNPGIDAIEWAMGDFKGTDNKWSLEKGKDYMKRALVEKDETKRRQLLAKAWRCFGEVLHNLADMACPPHTRNDSHAAPLGLGWGWALGSPDPYEELFRPEWVKDFLSNISENSFDPNLLQTISKAEKIREVHEAMAKFTNANFFTGETISGKQDTKNIKPLNGEKEYPSPKLENLEYVPEEFTYYKTFPSGRRVKMCKDDGYFSSLFRNRGYPYIDLECVKSQASELIPNFFAAALKDFYLFIPPLEVIIDEIDSENGTIKGTAKTYETEEYNQIIGYNGKVVVFVDSKFYNAECSNGTFELKLPKTEIENSKKIQAYVDFWGINYWSQPFQKSNYGHLKKFMLEITLKMVEESSGEIYDLSFNFISNNTITWQNNKFTHKEKTTSSSTEKEQTLYLEMNPYEKNYINKIIYDHKEQNHEEVGGYDLTDVITFHLELTQKDNLMWYSELMQWVDIWGAADLRKVLTNVSLVIVDKFGIYDDKGKIVGVNSKTYTYRNIDYSKDLDNRFTLWLMKQ